MTEEEVFLTAVDIENPSDPSAYLERACGSDAELRRQVDELLSAHFREGEFLNESALKQLEQRDTSSFGLDTAPSDAQGNQMPEDLAQGLTFVQPSLRPNSRGRIGHYEVLEVLGHGGFGIVLRAFDDLLQRVVALKVLSPSMAATSPARKRFLREASSSARVCHENVVRVYGVEEQPLPFLVMEFVPGETLQQRLDRTGPLQVMEIVQFGRQIAEGLAAAHATDLIHRDIKPANVLIEEGSQRVKVTDFGLARAADDASLTQSGVLAGTPQYMAPEQAKGDTLDQRADLFSLGSVLYVMAAGRPPFRAATTYAVLKRVVEDEPRPIREVIPETPQWLADIISKLHAKRPEDRFQSAREVADMLAACDARLRSDSRLDDFPRVGKRKPALGWAGNLKWMAAIPLLLAFAFVVSEIAGMTRWTQTWKPTNNAQPIVQQEIETRPRSGHQDVRGDFTNTLGMSFRRIPAGKFRMGSSQEEIDHFVGTTADKGYERMLAAEGPEHEVEITQPFYMGTTEVTLGQFRKFLESNVSYAMADERWLDPGFDQSNDHPVVWVSFQHAIDFCKWLSQKEGKLYRLPTEAEWEYSCRAGKPQQRFCFGNDKSQLEEYAWYHLNASTGTHRVAEKKPNDWGLYDMHGNVWEWCQDVYDPMCYDRGDVKDPIVTKSSWDAVIQRGGSWGFGSLVCRSAFRSYCHPSEVTHQRGFRVVLVSAEAVPAGKIK